MKSIRKLIFKLRYRSKKFYINKAVPFLLSSAKLFKKIGINKLIEIRILKTIFFYKLLFNICYFFIYI